MSTELLTLNPDGTTTVHLLDRKVTLRRPTLGEFRKMREGLEAEQDAHQPRSSALQAESAAVNSTDATKVEDEDALRERLEALRIETREVIRLAEEIRERFFTNMVTTLGKDGDNITEAEYPPQVIEANWIAEVIQHWRSRPTDPGVI